ncbi:hypothetical protein KSB_67770 [Ktedonobacter robiniae]|uniref:Uncharacterized protein n=1 Tax=Ktedonobacter robiniae TaxID=2778365 RepID=A0ABQ3V148_9CHLR|nr:hypothetical protein KSB_67770 [Ktedonobacter robiniae]
MHQVSFPHGPEELTPEWFTAIFPLKELEKETKTPPCGSSDPREPHPQARMLEAGLSDLSRGQRHLISQPFKLPGCPSLSMLAI